MRRPIWQLWPKSRRICVLRVFHVLATFRSFSFFYEKADFLVKTQEITNSANSPQNQCSAPRFEGPESWHFWQMVIFTFSVSVPIPICTRNYKGFCEILGTEEISLFTFGGSRFVESARFLKVLRKL